MLQSVHNTAWLAALLLSIVVVATPRLVYGQTDLPTDETRCELLRTRATAVHQERASMSNTEDILALAVGMETLDVSLDEIAREYARLGCGRSSDEDTADE
ncbi:MAG: hypothetical protein Rhims3KO_00820 [Hyphomicrobiales bacterium]